MKEEILSVLRNTDGYVSGQALCDRLGVSRTAIWKVMKQLKDEGYEIEAVNNRGYRIILCPDIISREEILSQLNTVSIGRSIEYYQEVGSTNNEAKLLAEQGAEHGTLVVAESQNSGKGRRGRVWTSPPGDGIWMSLVLRPDILPVNASMLTLIAALAVSDALTELVEGVTIKWPNDVLISGKKVCGILTEMSADMDNINYVITGIGINVNIHEFPEEIKPVATSLYIERGNVCARAEIIKTVMERFEYYYDIFCETQDLTQLMDVYNSRLVNCHKEVRVIYAREEFTGMAKGINQRGELIVEADGRDICVASGEVSVRGVLGYV